MDPFPSIFNLDAACLEDYGFLVENQENVIKTPTLSEADVFWDDDELHWLLSKEKASGLSTDFESNNNVKARKESLEWILEVVAGYGFTALTAVLAVKYYDTYVSSKDFDKEFVWLPQLTAVACLAIATKMEEVQVPYPVKLQMVKTEYVFDPNTILKMEFRVLDVLRWRTSIVTPFSFIDHFVRRLGLIKTNYHVEFLKRCEHILLVIIADFRLVRCLSSVVATTTMLFVLGEIDPSKVMNHENLLLDVLNINKEDVSECYKIIVEVMDNQERETRKRKNRSILGSVVDAILRRGSSNELCSAPSSVSKSPEPIFKSPRINQ